MLWTLGRRRRVQASQGTRLLVEIPVADEWAVAPGTAQSQRRETGQEARQKAFVVVVVVVPAAAVAAAVASRMDRRLGKVDGWG